MFVEFITLVFIVFDQLMFDQIQLHIYTRNQLFIQDRFGKSFRAEQNIAKY